jgi:hypothetical protein
MSTPFSRLATAHALSTAGDALVALSLAGSLFFSVDPSGARWRIALYLVFTMAPFAVVGPLIGPAMDRAKGGHRLMMVGATAGRALVALALVPVIGGEGLLLFPLAFLMLVLAKTYQVAKAAIVPTIVTSDQALVEANSKLQVLAGISGLVAGIPGGLLLLLAGPGAVEALALVVFLLAMLATTQVPKTTVAASPADEAEEEELRSAGVRSAASGMGTLRAAVGFVTFLLAFALRGHDKVVAAGASLGRAVSLAAGAKELTPEALVVHVGPPKWHFGVVLVMSVGGGLLGAAVAPTVRKAVREEWLLVGSLTLATLGGLMGAAFIGLTGQALLALCIGISAAAGKQAFDAVVQRDAPDANRGRSFARFESRFQVAWVCGAFVPVVIAMPTRLGGGIVMVMAAVAAVILFLAVRALDRGEAPTQIPAASAAARRAIRRRTSRPAAGTDDLAGVPVDPGPAEASPVDAPDLDATEEMEPPGPAARPRPFDIEAVLEASDLVGGTPAETEPGLREVQAPPPDDAASTQDEPFDCRLF